MTSGGSAGLRAMVIVSGFLHVRPHLRAAYLDGCRALVEQARSSSGCLDFALSPDLLDPGRVNILERWVSVGAVEEFRGTGPANEQSAVLLDAEVSQFEVSAEQRLTVSEEVA
jgi:quinol monooxygenase YgiN